MGIVLEGVGAEVLWQESRRLKEGASGDERTNRGARQRCGGGRRARGSSKADRREPGHEAEGFETEALRGSRKPRLRRFLPDHQARRPSRCDCPDFRQIPQRPWEHIRAVIRYVKESQSAQTPADLEGPPEITKSRTAWQLEYPLRPDQVKTRNGLEYSDGAAVLQQFNDALGSANRSLRILGQPVDLHSDVLSRGRRHAPDATLSEKLGVRYPEKACDSFDWLGVRRTLGSASRASLE